MIYCCRITNAISKFLLSDSGYSNLDNMKVSNVSIVMAFGSLFWTSFLFVYIQLNWHHIQLKHFDYDKYHIQLNHVDNNIHMDEKRSVTVNDTYKIKLSVSTCHYNSTKSSKTFSFFIWACHTCNRISMNF